MVKYIIWKPNQQATARLRKAVEYLREEPRRFNMKTWGVQYPDLFDPSPLIPPCGTACCLAGALALQVDRTFFGTEMTPILALNSLEVPKLLRMAVENRLFYISGWPAEFKRQYSLDAITLSDIKNNVELLAAYIEQVIAYGLKIPGTAYSHPIAELQITELQTLADVEIVNDTINE